MGQKLAFRLMTYNVGGGRNPSPSLSHIIEVIEGISPAPDVLVIQEATEFLDADGDLHSDLSQIAQAGEFGQHAYFGSTLSVRENMHVQKNLFIRAVFRDWQDWRQGNAVLSRWEFTRLSAPSIPGVPRNIPIYQTPLYQGNRDTDPRYALLTRINRAPAFPFIVGVHLTTLVGERGQNADPDKIEEAQKLRAEQTKRLLDLLRKHVLEPKELVFLLGDFNAVASEPCISSVLEKGGGFVRLAPAEELSTMRREAPEPIDHIFVYPGDRLVDYRCWVADSPTARRASDHLPVIADIVVSCP
ncbi:MAG: endonuclease/exonuclease/phosphatase family protein [Anaerolineae bacterium]|nr:endonuclease/exonuclease/phosphatase family protein [Anaerolineae bacterium]